MGLSTSPCGVPKDISLNLLLKPCQCIDIYYLRRLLPIFILASSCCNIKCRCQIKKCGKTSTSVCSEKSGNTVLYTICFHEPKAMKGNVVFNSYSEETVSSIFCLINLININPPSEAREYFVVVISDKFPQKAIFRIFHSIMLIQVSSGQTRLGLCNYAGICSPTDKQITKTGQDTADNVCVEAE